MKILAIETASPPGAIALLDGNKVVDSRPIKDARKTTQHFAIMIEKMLADANWAPSSIQLTTAHTGPGSFTGLRIGITAAKVFAFAVRAKVLGINTLETLAFQSFQENPSADFEVEAVIDAQRKQLFAARFHMADGQVQNISPTKIISVETWLQENTSGAMLTGPGLKRIEDQLPTGSQLAEQILPQATALGQLAFAKAQQGLSVAPMELAPTYFRKSAAEEKAEKQSNQA